MANNVISPYNSNQELDMNNIFAILFLFFISLFTSMSTIISVIDKLFFKKFYQAPNYRKVIRISLILSIEVVINIYLKIIEDWDLFVITISALILISILILSAIRQEDKSVTREKL